MENNFFITGRMNTGKTYIIRKILDELGLTPGGFMVGRDQGEIGWSSFYLLPADIYLQNNKDKIDKIKSKGTFVWKDKNKKIQLNSEVFDNYGVELLNKGINEDIIIMDELGRFEFKAYNFQDKVIELIKSDKLVLGVIKLEKNNFLDRVRNILKKEPIMVTEVNREKVYRYLLAELKKWRIKNDQSYLTCSR